MSKIIAIFNMKGGVGKTTTAYNAAHGLSRFHGKKVLVLDIDPQGHSSASLGIDILNLNFQIKDVLLRQNSLKDIIVQSSFSFEAVKSQPSSYTIDVAPSNLLLAENEIPISGLPGRELILRKAIAKSYLRDKYDYILIDCPPNVGVFSINALMASDEVLVPVDMSYFGLLGIASVEKIFHLIRSELDHPIELAGILATRFDIRNKISSEVLQSLKSRFNDSVYKTVIPENIKIREAPSFAIPVFDRAPGCHGSQAYSSLVEELQ